MRNKLLFLSLFFLLQSPSYGIEKGFIDRFYKVLPEADSLLHLGTAMNSELPGNRIKSLIWNIKKTEMKGWQKEFLKFAQDKDLILIQEAFTNELLQKTLNSFTGVRWDMGVSFLYKKNDDAATGTMIGSYVEPRETLVKHSPDREPLLNTPKAITFAKYPVAGSPDELLVISVHAINFVSTASFKRHIDVVSAQIDSHQGPVLLAGDFNTWNLARTNYLMNMVKKAGLTTVTFKNGNSRTKFDNYFLDHGFVRGAVVTNAEVLVESIGSDHKPLVIDLFIL